MPPSILASRSPSSLPRRVPLWATFLPLLIGGLGYGWLWSGYAERLRADVALVLPGRAVTISGFPYRVAASVDAVRLAVDDPGLAASVTATAASVDRGPWHPELSVVRLSGVHFRLAVPPLGAATAAVDAPAALVSIHLEHRTLQRLSTVFDHPHFAVGLFPAPLTATRLETHVRELPPATAAAGPTPPAQAQLVVAGTDVRLAGGDPLRLDADIAVTGNRPLRSFAAWAAGGTAEVRRLALADASGEVLVLMATAVSGSAGTLQFSGTVDTVCPASVAVLFGIGGAISERRLRRPVRLSFAGLPGAFRLNTPDTASLARRTQLPPCPVLRR